MIARIVIAAARLLWFACACGLLALFWLAWLNRGEITLDPAGDPARLAEWEAARDMGFLEFAIFRFDAADIAVLVGALLLLASAILFRRFPLWPLAPVGLVILNLVVFGFTLAGEGGAAATMVAGLSLPFLALNVLPFMLDGDTRRR